MSFLLVSQKWNRVPGGVWSFPPVPFPSALGVLQVKEEGSGASQE